MPASPSSPLPRNRHRALASLDALIREAELAQERQRQEIERILAEGREPRRTTAALGFAEERLAQLHRSREFLLADDEPKRR